MYWVFEFMDIFKIAAWYPVVLVLISTFFFHSKAVIRNLMLMSSAETVLMQNEMKMPLIDQ